MVLTAYCINLNRRKERLKSILTQYKKISDTFVRINAIDTQSSYGCGLSHMKCIKIAKEKNMDYILVIEDDCIFKKEAKEILLQKLNDINNDWDILLGGISYYTKNVKYIKKIDLFKLEDFSGFFCTIYNKRCYDKMLNWKNMYDNSDKKFKKIIRHIDRYAGYLSKNKNLNVYCIHPFIATTIEGFSDIRKKKVNDNIKYISKTEKKLDELKN